MAAFETIDLVAEQSIVVYLPKYMTEVLQLILSIHNEVTVSSPPCLDSCLNSAQAKSCDEQEVFLFSP